MSEVNKVVVDDKISTWIDTEMMDFKRFGIHLMVCNNGFQASGAAIYSIEAAKAAHKSLGDFISQYEENTNE